MRAFAATLVFVLFIAFTLRGMNPPHESAAPIEAATSSQPAAAIESVPLAATTTPKGFRVVKVVDGDTLDIDLNGTTTRLRLIGMDTPETVDPRKPVQCFGKAASDKAKALLSGVHVEIERDASQGDLDKYGRTLAYVYLPDGTMFNEYMIAEGYAHEYTYRLPYKYQDRFKAAEVSAREQKKGLWADEACAAESAR